MQNTLGVSWADDLQQQHENPPAPPCGAALVLGFASETKETRPAALPLDVFLGDTRLGKSKPEKGVAGPGPRAWQSIPF